MKPSTMWVCGDLTEASVIASAFWCNMGASLVLCIFLPREGYMQGGGSSPPSSFATHRSLTEISLILRFLVELIVLT